MYIFLSHKRLKKGNVVNSDGVPGYEIYEKFKILQIWGHAISIV